MGASGQAAAASTEERIDLLDALRGFALLGILLANILIFSGWEFYDDAGRIALAGKRSTEWQHWFHHFFIDGKFYTIFSLLFGAGFALQLERLTRRGADGLRIYRRRTLILLGIGLVHECLVWDGDILVLYALMGLILPLFYRFSDRTVLTWAAVLIFFVPPIGAALFRLLGWPEDLSLRAISDSVAMTLGALNVHDGVTWLRREDFTGWFSWIVSGPIFSWGLKILSWRVPKVLGIMLLGMWLGRRLADGRLLQDRQLLLRVFVAGLLIGVPANLAYAVGNQNQMSWPSLIGTVPMGLAYASGFALLWPVAKRWLRLFAAPGRMALTNYFSQSVICIITFYGIGFGQVGYWPPAGFYAFALALFAAQSLFSHWWLSTHAQGPLEKLWRRWTYGSQKRLTASPAQV